MDELAGGVWLHFGNGSSPSDCGILFISTNLPYWMIFGTTNLYGRYFVIQIINQSHIKENFLDGIHSKQLDCYGLDGYFPYQGHYQWANSDGIWYDAPADEMAGYKWISRNESFTDYLMFEPYGGGIDVPMLKLTWTWSGEVTTNGISGGYTLLSDRTSPTCSGLSSTTEFPQWTTNAACFQWQTNNYQF